MVLFASDPDSKTPCTSNAVLGELVPIPTLPALVIRMRSVFEVAKSIGADSLCQI
jgi:hypothetical protein